MLHLVKISNKTQNQSYYHLLDKNFNRIEGVEICDMEVRQSDWTRLHITVLDYGFEMYTTDDLDKFIEDKKVEAL